MSSASEFSHQGRVVKKEIRIRADLASVWSAWADPERIAQWFVDRAEGRAEAGHTMTWHFEDMDVHLPIPILEAKPDESLVIGGELPGRPPFLQEVRLRTDDETGETILWLANSGFGDGAEWDDEYDGVDSGWELALATLKHWLETYPDGRRDHTLVTHPADFAYEQVMPYYTTAAGLEGWLGTDAEVEEGAPVGGRFALTLADGARLDGRVVARSKREVLLAWPGENALLALKAFCQGPAGRFAALDYSAWPTTTNLEARRGVLTESLERLVATLA